MQLGGGLRIHKHWEVLGGIKVSSTWHCIGRSLLGGVDSPVVIVSLPSDRPKLIWVYAIVFVQVSNGRRTILTWVSSTVVSNSDAFFNWGTLGWVKSTILIINAWHAVPSREAYFISMQVASGRERCYIFLRLNIVIRCLALSGLFANDNAPHLFLARGRSGCKLSS